MKPKTGKDLNKMKPKTEKNLNKNLMNLIMKLN